MKKIMIGLVTLILLIVLAGGAVLPHFNRNTYKATVTEKQVKRSDDSDKYMIFCELEDGSVRVFQNVDSLIEGKFDSSDMYAKIKQGRKYEFEVYGWRIRFMSMYENIKEIREIK